MGDCVERGGELAAEVDGEEVEVVAAEAVRSEDGENGVAVYGSS